MFRPGASACAQTKLRLIEIYNARLTERERRRRFILDRGLLNVKSQQVRDSVSSSHCYMSLQAGRGTARPVWLPVATSQVVMPDACTPSASLAPLSHQQSTVEFCVCAIPTCTDSTTAHPTNCASTKQGTSCVASDLAWPAWALSCAHLNPDSCAHTVPLRQAAEKRRLPGEKELHERMRVFARYMPQAEHDDLVDALVLEQRLQHRIQVPAFYR